MKRLLLIILAFTTINYITKAQDSTALVASQQEFNPSFPASYASIQTLNGSNLRITGDWTIEAWIKIGMPSFNMHVVETYSAANTGGFVLRLQSNKVKALQISSPSSSSSVTGTTVIPQGEWHHIAATLNETTKELKVFLDGKLEGTTTTSLKTKNNNVGLYIGARGDDRKVAGILEIDDVKIWDIAKTQEKIQADTLACFTGNETGLLAMYDFENITGNALVDKSSNNNTGNLINSNFVNRIYTCESYVLGIEETDQASLSIYPNPAIDEVTIETQEQIKNIQIFNVFGTLMQIETTSTFTIDNLSSGVYFAKVETKKGVATVKFIKE